MQKHYKNTKKSFSWMKEKNFSDKYRSATTRLSKNPEKQ